MDDPWLMWSLDVSWRKIIWSRSVVQDTACRYFSLLAPSSSYVVVESISICVPEHVFRYDQMMIVDIVYLDNILEKDMDDENGETRHGTYDASPQYKGRTKQSYWSDSHDGRRSSQHWTSWKRADESTTHHTVLLHILRLQSKLWPGIFDRKESKWKKRHRER